MRNSCEADKRWGGYERLPVLRKWPRRFQIHFKHSVHYRHCPWHLFPADGSPGTTRQSDTLSRLHSDSDPNDRAKSNADSDPNPKRDNCAQSNADPIS